MFAISNPELVQIIFALIYNMFSFVFISTVFKLLCFSFPCIVHFGLDEIFQNCTFNTLEMFSLAWFQNITNAIICSLGTITSMLFFIAVAGHYCSCKPTTATRCTPCNLRCTLSHFVLEPGLYVAIY